MESVLVSSEDLGKLKVKLTITVPQEEVQSAFKKCYLDLKKKVSIPGFRKGNCPQSVIEKRFMSHMKQDVVEKLVPNYFEKALKQENLEPIGRPHFGNMDAEKNKQLVFTVTFEKRPEFEPPAYDAFNLEKQELEMTEEEIQKQKETHLQRAATFEVREAPAEDGDQVVINYRPETENEHIPAENDYDYTLGSKQLLPEFEETLPGMSANEEKTFEASYPEDHPKAELQGVKANIVLKLKEVKKRILPELNEEFFQKYGEKVNTEEEFNEFIENEIKGKHEFNAKAAYRTDLKKQLETMLDFEVPEQLFKDEVKALLNQAQEKNKGEEELSEEELRVKAEKDALDQIRFGFYIRQMLENEEIKVEESAVHQRFQMNCMMMGIDPQQMIKEEYGRQFLEQTHGVVAEETVLDYVTDRIFEK